MRAAINHDQLNLKFRLDQFARRKNLLGPDKIRETPRFGGVENLLLLEIQRDLPVTMNAKGRGR